MLTPPAELKRAALAEHEATLDAARRLATRAVNELGASRVLLLGPGRGTTGGAAATAT